MQAKADQEISQQGDEQQDARKNAFGAKREAGHGQGQEGGGNQEQRQPSGFIGVAAPRLDLGREQPPADGEDRAADSHQDRGTAGGRRFLGIGAHHFFSITRSFAERLRGFSAASTSEASM